MKTEFLPLKGRLIIMIEYYTSVFPGRGRLKLMKQVGLVKKFQGATLPPEFQAF
jgi:hypothetical protein